MTEGDVDDQKKENRQEPNKPATVADLKDLGIQYWKMDAENFTYPVKSVPWDPKDAVDPVSFFSLFCALWPNDRDIFGVLWTSMRSSGEDMRFLYDD